TRQFYQTKAQERLATTFGHVPGTGNYYGNTGPGRAHRSADASLYLMQNTSASPGQGIGQMRAIARTPVPAAPPGSPPGTAAPPDPLQGSVTSFAQTAGQPGTPQQANDFRRGLEQRLASDPTRGPDTSGWTRDQRVNYETNMAMRRFDADQQRARDA